MKGNEASRVNTVSEKNKMKRKYVLLYWERDAGGWFWPRGFCDPCHEDYFGFSQGSSL